MNTQPVVCRRVEDTQGQTLSSRSKSKCSKCDGEIYVEQGDEFLEPKFCLSCAAQHHPHTCIFVEMTPDEFGGRSISKGAKEVFDAQDGQWHKNGIWHSQQSLLRFKD